ncbi:MAG: hypothetical protein Q4D06_05970 [Coriobacteriia bacterium]|nr:hypothetical protein [Coriobacteriia bacterium]
MVTSISQRAARIAAVFALVLGAAGLVAATSGQAQAVTYVDGLTTSSITVNCDLSAYNQVRVDYVEASAQYADDSTYKKRSWEIVPNSNRVKVKGLAAGVYYGIRIHYSYNFSDDGTWYDGTWSTFAKTVPNKPTKVKIADQLYATKKLSVSFKTGACDGYTVKLDPVKKGLSNKYIKSDYGVLKTGYATTTYASASQNTAYYATVRTWVKDDNNKKYYSAWSTKIRLLPQPVLTKAKSIKGGIRIYWNKVSGASSYTLYTSTTRGNWSKVGTFKSTYKNLKTVKGRSIKVGKTYYAMVVANYGSKYKSPKALCRGFYRYYT